MPALSGADKQDVMSDQGSSEPIEVEETLIQDSEAEYTLEYLAACPRCGEAIKTLRVIRLLRTRVNFVSTLPRRGRVLACPFCRAIISGELSLG
jgi:hypothetical protein